MHLMWVRRGKERGHVPGCTHYGRRAQPGLADVIVLYGSKYQITIDPVVTEWRGEG